MLGPAVSTIMLCLKDALLCLLICAILASAPSNLKAAIASLGTIVLLFLLGLDF